MAFCYKKTGGCSRLRNMTQLMLSLALLIGASRAYQANLTAIGLIRDLVQKSLELGR